MPYPCIFFESIVSEKRERGTSETGNVKEGGEEGIYNRKVERAECTMTKRSGNEKRIRARHYTPMLMTLVQGHTWHPSDDVSDYKIFVDEWPIFDCVTWHSARGGGKLVSVLISHKAK